MSEEKPSVEEIETAIAWADSSWEPRIPGQKNYAKVLAAAIKSIRFGELLEIQDLRAEVAKLKEQLNIAAGQHPVVAEMLADKACGCRMWSETALRKEAEALRYKRALEEITEKSYCGCLRDDLCTGDCAYGVAKAALSAVE